MAKRSKESEDREMDEPDKDIGNLTEELKTLVQKLKANREKVPVEVLKTKYKKPYEELLGQIKAATSDLATRIALKDIVIMKDDSEKLVADIQTEINRWAKEISHAAFKEYDVDKVVALAKKTHTAIWNLWIPYWQSHCGLYVLPENWEEGGGTPRIYNELTDEFLVDEEKNVWEKHPEWKNENRCFIAAGACSLLAKAFENKKEDNNQ